MLQAEELHQSRKVYGYVQSFSVNPYLKIVLKYLNEAKEFVMHGFIVLTSQYHTKKVQESLQIIRKRIEEYPSLPDTLKQLDKMPDNVTEGRPPDDAELLQHLAGDEMQKTTKQLRRARTDLDIFWDDCFKEIERETNPDSKSAKLYYLPAYFEYLREYKLPTLAIWTCLTLGNLNRFNKKYNVGLPKQQGRNILV